MDLTRVQDVKTAMKLAGIRPNKGLGQHFLVDSGSLAAIIAAAAPNARDTVLEVGPGLGVMTRPLLAVSRHVVAVETDPIFVELLERDAPDNLSVHHGDILEFDLATLPHGYKVIANIPYYLTSKLIRRLIEAANPPSVMSLLIQKEVAERIVARPGSMSLLALSVQYYADVEIAGIVDRSHFWPAPEVDSAVLKITMRAPAFPAEPSKLFRLMKAGFGEKRKQLKNSLAGGLHIDGDVAIGLVAAAGLAPSARAQELELGQWHKLYDVALAKGFI